MKDTVSKRLLKKHVRKFQKKNCFQRHFLNEVEKYLDIITENDITDLQNKLLTLNLNEMELFFFQNIIHKLFTEVKFLKT